MDDRGIECFLISESSQEASRIWEWPTLIRFQCQSPTNHVRNRHDFHVKTNTSKNNKVRLILLFFRFRKKVDHERQLICTYICK